MYLSRLIFKMKLWMHGNGTLLLRSEKVLSHCIMINNTCKDADPHVLILFKSERNEAQKVKRGYIAL